MMIGNEPLPDPAVGTPRPPLSDEMRRTLKSVGDYIERAREHHARTGEWPPDPLLDEVDEMRRRVQAEHGDDPRKVLEWYIETGKQHAQQNEDSAKRDASAGASRP